MDLQTIKALVAAMADSDLAEMTFSEAGWTLTLRRTATASPTLSPVPAARPASVLPVPPVPPPSGTEPGDIQAPLAGILHLQPEPGAPPFAPVGATVRQGQTLCLIEAMKVFNAVRASRDGTLAAVLLASGTEVDAGQTLMRLA